MTHWSEYRPEDVLREFSKYCKKEDISGLGYPVFYEWWYSLNENGEYSPMMEYVARYGNGTLQFWREHIQHKPSRAQL